MRSDTLTPKQQMLLWSLVARGGSALQADTNVKLTEAERRTLAAGKLVATTRQGRANRLELTDEGWRVIGEGEPALVAGTDRKIPTERVILQSVLLQLARYMRDEKVAPATIFRPLETKAAGPEPAAPARPRKPRAPKTAPPGTETGPGRTRKPPARSGRRVEEAIRTAYRAIAGEPAREAVRLSVLRARLPGIPRADLDAALLAMRRDGRANLMNLDNPRDIAPEKEAALTSGIHTYHVVWIER